MDVFRAKPSLESGKISLNNANGTFAGTGLIVDGLQSPLAGPFSLSIPPRSCLAITGPSGSGKSLLLRLVADLDAGTGVVKHKWCGSICPDCSAVAHALPIRRGDTGVLGAKCCRPF